MDFRKAALKRASDSAVDERVTRARVNGRIVEQVEHLYENPQGKVNLELRNDRGKLVHQEEKTNFVSRLWAITSRSWQRTGWGQWGLTFNEGLDIPNYDSTTKRFQMGGPVFKFPNDVVGCWNDSSAETPLSEDTVRTDGGGLVAWASRLPIGSPSIARGAVNIEDSFWDETGETMVYDWPTTAGNGTFRSVGYTVANIADTYKYPSGRLRLNPERRRYLTTDTRPNIFFLVSSTSGSVSKPGLDNSSNLIVPYCESGGFFKYLVIPSSNWNQAWAFDGFGAAEDTLSSSSSSVISASNGYSSVGHNFLGEYDSLYWFSGVNFTTNPSGGCYGFAVNKSTYAMSRQFAISATATSGNYRAQTGGIIGSSLYVAGGYNGSGQNYQILRYDLTSTPPSLSATIELDHLPFGTASAASITDMTPDGTDLWVKILVTSSPSPLEVWARYNTSGDLLEVWGELSVSGTSAVGSFPYNATYGVGGFGIFENLELFRPQDSGSIVYARTSQNATNGYWRSHDDIWAYTPWTFWGNSKLNQLQVTYDSSDTSDVTTALSISEIGYNLGSRVLLGSDTTKTSSDTMKITYQITLPSCVL